MLKARVVPDEKWPNMFRVQWPDGITQRHGELSAEPMTQPPASTRPKGVNNEGGRAAIGAPRTSIALQHSAPDLPHSQITSLTAPSSLAA